MKKIFGSATIFLTACAAFFAFAAVQPEVGHADEAAQVIAEGKKIAFDRRKGNCLSCHIMDDGLMPGTHGPPLIFMQRRFPDKAKLRERIHDATAANPNTMMPPFGRHGILTDDEIDKITEYVFTL